MTEEPRSPKDDTPATDLASFTSQKLDWLVCLSYDPHISPMMFEVGFAVMQHVNAKTLRAWVSDETIAEKTGVCIRDVQRARNRLRNVGWLSWKRTGKANVYEPLFDRIDSILDELTIMRDERKERQRVRRERTLMSDQRPSEQTPLAERDQTMPSDRDTTPESDIHLSENT